MAAVSMWKLSKGTTSIGTRDNTASHIIHRPCMHKVLLYTSLTLRLSVLVSTERVNTPTTDNKTVVVHSTMARAPGVQQKKQVARLRWLLGQHNTSLCTTATPTKAASPAASGRLLGRVARSGGKLCVEH